MKKSIKTNIIAICTLSVISLLSINVSALDYQKTINVGFNLQDTLTVSLSSPNLIIDDLMPGTASDSNIITVNVLSNNPYGYTLNSTVGSTTYANRNLTHSSSASATPFSSINYGTTVADLSSFSPNQWGYSFSTDNGTTWINSNKTDGTTNDTGYSGLPLYTDTENITTLKESSTTSAAAGDNIQFKIAAKADATQLSGEYNNIINFILTGNPKPKTYMQDLTLSQCAVNVGEGDNPAGIGDNVTVYDGRDESDYTVRYINGQCWMTQNLRITGTIPAEGSNFTGNDFDVSQYSLDSTDASYAGHCDSTNGYNYACAKDSGNTTTGVWYNYYAASAGTIATDNNTAPTAEDICPFGWHLPTGPNTTIGTDINKLVGNTTSGWQYPPSSFYNTFNTIAGGHYANGVITDSTNGYWWTANALMGEGGRYRFSLYYNNSNKVISGNNNNWRSLGRFVRCVRTS